MSQEHIRKLIGTLMTGVVGVALLKFGENPISTLLQDSPWWTLLFLVLVIAGIVVQLRAKPVPEIDQLAAGSYPGLLARQD